MFDGRRRLFVEEEEEPKEVAKVDWKKVRKKKKVKLKYILKSTNHHALFAPFMTAISVNFVTAKVLSK